MPESKPTPRPKAAKGTTFTFGNFTIGAGKIQSKERKSYTAHYVHYKITASTLHDHAVLRGRVRYWVRTDYEMLSPGTQVFIVGKAFIPPLTPTIDIDASVLLPYPGDLNDPDYGKHVLPVKAPFFFTAGVTNSGGAFVVDPDTKQDTKMYEFGIDYEDYVFDTDKSSFLRYAHSYLVCYFLSLYHFRWTFDTDQRRWLNHPKIHPNACLAVMGQLRAIDETPSECEQPLPVTVFNLLTYLFTFTFD
jgi:hypothetical protein